MYGCVAHLVIRSGAGWGVGEGGMQMTLLKFVVYCLNGGADNYSFQVSSILLPDRFHHTSSFLKCGTLFPEIVQDQIQNTR